MTTSETVSAVIAGTQALIALVGLLLVVNQLRKMAEQNKIAADAQKSAAESAQSAAASTALMATANEIAAKAQAAAAESAKIAADAASLSAAMAVVQLEQAVATSRGQLADFAAEMHQRKDDSKFMDAAAVRLPELIEQYLNNSDRLCSYIIRGYIDEEYYREDFRNWLTEMVRDYKERFGPDSRHRNILHVHHAWADGKKARKA